MKKFFILVVKEGSIQSGYLFILINVVWFAGGIAGLDYGNFDNVLQIFWTFSVVGILLGLKDLQGDTVPEDWRQGFTMIAAAVAVAATPFESAVGLNTETTCTAFTFVFFTFCISFVCRTQ